jgi:hypothetical protein
VSLKRERLKSIYKNEESELKKIENDDDLNNIYQLHSLDVK